MERKGKIGEERERERERDERKEREKTQQSTIFFFTLTLLSLLSLKTPLFLSKGFRHALYHPRERARPLSGTSTPTKRHPIYAPVARGGASLFGGGGGSAAVPVSDPEVEVAPSGFLPPPDIPLYARRAPSAREGPGGATKKDAALSEVAQAEADKTMVRIEREVALPPPAASSAAGGGEGFAAFDAESARKVQQALSDAQAADRRKASALEAAAEASTESNAAAKRAQAAAREMGSGASALPDRERARLEGVKSRLERGRERAEDAIMALKTAEDARVAAEAQKADALAVAR